MNKNTMILIGALAYFFLFTKQGKGLLASVMPVNLFKSGGTSVGYNKGTGMLGFSSGGTSVAVPASAVGGLFSGIGKLFSGGGSSGNVDENTGDEGDNVSTGDYGTDEEFLAASDSSTDASDFDAGGDLDP